MRLDEIVYDDGASSWEGTWLFPDDDDRKKRVWIARSKTTDAIVEGRSNAPAPNYYFLRWAYFDETQKWGWLDPIAAQAVLYHLLAKVTDEKEKDKHAKSI